MAAMREYSHSKEYTYHEAGVESGKYSPQPVYSPHQTPRSGEGINISNQSPPEHVGPRAQHRRRSAHEPRIYTQVLRTSCDEFPW